jgi:hypothetical protein
MTGGKPRFLAVAFMAIGGPVDLESGCPVINLASVIGESPGALPLRQRPGRVAGV